ncbi:MAG: acyloxyacyl hydrolase [Roseibium sp.]
MSQIIWTIGFMGFGLLVAVNAQAADQRELAGLLAVDGPRHELRGGVMYHDAMNRESGVDLNAEYLSRFAAFQFTIPGVNMRTALRPHIGGSLNTAGDTSFVYGGYSLAIDLTKRFFIEGSLGGMVHNGVDVRPDNSRLSLGCNVMFREAASLGFRITDHWNVSAMVEHGSNGGRCEANNGLTNAGVRLGYSF